MNLIIGSGDIKRLLVGKHSSGFQDLLRNFVAAGKPHYNAYASPIDACRIGAILEQRYLLTLPDNYYTQYKVVSKELDVFVSTLDFAKIVEGKVADFDELKTLYLPDFIEIIEPMRLKGENEYLPVIIKKFKGYYNQIQGQIYCSELDSANLVFLAVESYKDDENRTRDLQLNDYIKFRIKRDEKVISQIKNRLLFFQEIKNYFKL